MNQRTDISEEICSDEIVRFLADRYHTNPRKVLERFLEQNNPGFEMVAGAFRLEENEMAILRDMMGKESNVHIKSNTQIEDNTECKI